MAAEVCVDRPGRNAAQKAHRLLIRFAARDVVNVDDVAAFASHVCDDDHRISSASAKLSRFICRGGNRIGEVERRDVRGDGRIRRVRRRQSDDADARAGDGDDDRLLRPRRRLSCRFLHEVRREERPLRELCVFLERAEGILIGMAGNGVGTDGTVIEFMIADSGRGIADGVVRERDRFAFEEIGLERPLIEIAGVDHDHAARIRCPQGIEVRREDCQTAVRRLIVMAVEPAVNVGGPDDHDVHRFMGSRRRARARREQQEEE